MPSAYEEALRAGGLKGFKGERSHGRKCSDGLRENLVSPDDYLPTTRRYLDKCGWDAKVGVIARAMRADKVPVGLWLNPCLNYLTGSDYEISNNLPEGFPLPIKMVNGRRVVVRPDKG